MNECIDPKQLFACALIAGESDPNKILCSKCGISMNEVTTLNIDGDGKHSAKYNCPQKDDKGYWCIIRLNHPPHKHFADLPRFWSSDECKKMFGIQIPEEIEVSRYITWSQVIEAGRITTEELQNYQLICRSCDTEKERLIALEKRNNAQVERSNHIQIKVKQILEMGEAYKSKFPTTKLISLVDQSVFNSFKNSAEVWPTELEWPDNKSFSNCFLVSGRRCKTHTKEHTVVFEKDDYTAVNVKKNEKIACIICAWNGARKGNKIRMEAKVPKRPTTSFEKQGLLIKKSKKRNLFGDEVYDLLGGVCSMCGNTKRLTFQLCHKNRDGAITAPRMNMKGGAKLRKSNLFIIEKWKKEVPEKWIEKLKKNFVLMCGNCHFKYDKCSSDACVSEDDE